MAMWVHPLPYVPPISHWQGVIQTLRERRVSRISVIASSHYDLRDLGSTPFAKSCSYVRRVGDLFAEANLSVRYRLGRPPDDDIRFMTHVKVVASTRAQWLPQYVMRESGVACTVVVASTTTTY